MMPPRIALERAEIADVVRVFYANIRAHAQLGAIFDKHVDDWPSHEAKITDFWAGAIRLERTYDGNPMQAHLNAGNVEPQHFKLWLSVFDEILEQRVASPQKEQWSKLAHRIGRGLCMGVADARRPLDAAPTL